MNRRLFQFFCRRESDVDNFLVEYAEAHMKRNINDFDWWDEDGEQYLFSRDQFEEFKSIPLIKALS